MAVVPAASWAATSTAQAHRQVVSSVGGNHLGIGAFGLLPEWDVVENPHEDYERVHNLPYGSVGPDPEDNNELRDRLRDVWDPTSKVESLRSYAMRNLAGRPPKRERRLDDDGTEDALELMGKFASVDESAVQVGELATMRLLKNGMRDYIDYALDEVDRYSRVGKTGAVHTFSWRAQGNPSDVPSLRRSMGENGVTVDVLAELSRSQAAQQRSVPNRDTSASAKTLDLLRDELRAFKEEVHLKQLAARNEVRCSVV